MTYEERERQLCNNCEAKENCFYISRNLERKCSFREATMYGWELGYKDATNKALEWIEKFAHNSVITDNIGEREKQAIIISFKDYLEEEQQ
jgi:hypothetical protein